MIDLQRSLMCFLKLTMMPATCPECDMKCSRKDALLRYKWNRHGTTQPYPQNSEAYPPSNRAYPPPPPPQPQVVLQHPFTFMAIGPTFSGQSCRMDRLLIPAKTMIDPAPERIIWCYKRLQPLFSEMLSTIKNRLFLQGLSENLNDDSFIDTRYPSVIVVNDLMRDATKSKDVCELFLDGSNHRNISVTCILQDGLSKRKENITMSINTQYIVLFKNPKDLIGPAILARQMYHSHPKKFMIKYTEATKPLWISVHRPKTKQPRRR